MTLTVRLARIRKAKGAVTGPLTAVASALPHLPPRVVRSLGGLPSDLAGQHADRLAKRSSPPGFDS